LESSHSVVEGREGGELWFAPIPLI